MFFPRLNQFLTNPVTHQKFCCLYSSPWWGCTDVICLMEVNPVLPGRVSVETSNVFGNTTHFFAQSNQQLCVKPWLLCSIEIFKLTLVVYLQFFWSILKLQSLHTWSKGVPGFHGSAVVGLFNLIPQLYYLFLCLFLSLFIYFRSEFPIFKTGFFSI